MKGKAAGCCDGVRRERRIEASDQIPQRSSARPMRKICEWRLLANASISKKASRQFADERDPLRSKGNSKSRTVDVKLSKQSFQLNGLELSFTPVYLHTRHGRLYAAAMTSLHPRSSEVGSRPRTRIPLPMRPIEELSMRSTIPRSSVNIEWPG